MDYFGLNYYAVEYVAGFNTNPQDGVQYSDSGRSMGPVGLYQVLKEAKEVYLKDKDLPILVVENGVADSRDIFRPAYIIEHLLAIHQAIKDGIRVEGYIHWTISDNWEWADGYCPKFGLTAIDRENGFKRIKRPSFNLFSNIVRTGTITQQQRDAAWQLLQSNVGTNHELCRGEDGTSSLDEPRLNPVLAQDWRFYTGQESCSSYSGGYGKNSRASIKEMPKKG